MKKFLILAFLTVYHAGFGQITKDPKVTKKSTNDTFINRITITEDYTIVSMQFVSKSKEDLLKEYFNNNPEEKEKMRRMNPMMRNMILQQMLPQMGGSTISIQPTSYLRAEDGRKFNFIKASDIPVAPERLEVKPEEKYFFKVYFKKLDPGIEKVDLVEGDADERDGFHYWNFYGVEVNNPANGAAPAEEKPIESLVAEKTEFVLSGKVYDSKTDEPVSAKIVCAIEGDAEGFDSLQTSRTGYYEFLVKPKAYVYTISAPGYEDYVQELDLSTWKKSLTQDFYLQPVGKEDEPDVEKEEVAVKEDLEVVDENTLRLNNVYFPVGKSEIINKSYRELDKVVEMMKEKPEMRIRVDGHTDNQGDSQLNKVLSIDRAKAVRDYLISKGIAADRVEFKGWGDTKPVVSNADETERQKNRRVEITIL